MAPRALITDHLTGSLDVERGVLDPLGVELELAESSDEGRLRELAPGALALMVTYAQVPASVIEAATECRLIARYGIGVDNVDVEAATRRGIAVTNVPDYCLDEVADHAMALMLSHARHVVASAAGVRAGGWGHGDVPVRRLRGQRLALIGVGGIGRRVAARARSFGLEVSGFDPYLDPWDVDGVRRAADLEDAVREADIVSLHAPLTPESHHLIDADAIALMRRAPLLINTARGGLVDIDAVARALAEGRLRGAALDVTDPEPPPSDHALRADPAAVLTPHIAFYSHEAQAELLRRVAGEVARCVRGERPDRLVNAAALQVGR